MITKKKWRYNIYYSPNAMRIVIGLFYIYSTIALIIGNLSSINLLLIIVCFISNILVYLISKGLYRHVYKEQLKREFWYFFHLPDEKLMEQSETKPQDHRFYFKLYLLRLILKKVWKIFDSLPQHKKKELYYSWDFWLIMEELFYEMGISNIKFRDSHRWMDILNIKEIKFRNIEKLYHSSQMEWQHAFTSILKRCKTSNLVRQALLEHIEWMTALIKTYHKTIENTDSFWNYYCNYRKLPISVTSVIWIYDFISDIKPKFNEKILSRISIREISKLSLITQKEFYKILKDFTMRFRFVRTETFSNACQKAKKMFQINEYITLFLINNRTVIFVDKQEFLFCSYLLANIPLDDVHDYDELESIDDLESFSVRSYNLSPEMEFWGHCSNIQVWAENGYDTRLLHSNLSFPLLKKLCDVGDPQARQIFKEEIALRLEQGNNNVKFYLLESGYLDYLTKEECSTLLHSIDFLSLLKAGDFDNLRIIIYVGCLQYFTSEEIEEMFIKLMKEKVLQEDIHFFKEVLNHDIISYFSKEEMESMMKWILEKKALEEDIHPFINLIVDGFFQYLTNHEIIELIKQLKENVKKTITKEAEIDLLKKICLLYKEIKEEHHAEKYYILLLTHPSVNKRIWNIIHSSFPQFYNYRVCDAWRPVNPP